MILAKFETSIQITEDSWKVIFEEKLFPEETTLQEIESWFKAKTKERFQIHLSRPES